MKNLNVLFAILLLISWTSCTYVYYPTYPVIPVVKEKTAGVQATIGLSKAQISGWYSMDSNIFFIGAVSGALSWLVGDNQNREYYTTSATAGAGYEFRFNEKGQLQILGGGGVGQGHLSTNIFESKDGDELDIIDPEGMEVDVQSSRFFLQPSIGITGKNGGFYFVPRITYENFFNVKPSNNKIERTLFRRSFLIGEPFIMGRFSSKYVNLEVYGGLAINLNSYNQNGSDIFQVAQPFTFGFGLSKNF